MCDVRHTTRDVSRDNNPSHKGSAFGNPLYAEHLRLGATFGEKRIPLSYAGASSPQELAHATVLADVSHVFTLLLGGGPAPSFAHAAFAGEDLGVGSCAFEAVLTGDGAVASVPLLARTGDAEYIALDVTARAEVLDGWLSFLAAVEQDGVAPFAGLDTDDVTGAHALLLLWGPEAKAVLKDYLGADQQVPSVGEVASLLLDKLPCIVASLPGFASPCYLMFVPPVHAAVLWRSLLSFVQVTPVGVDDLMESMRSSLPWLERLGTTDVVRLSSDELVGWGLVRRAGDFVGARGLANGTGGARA